MAKKFRTAIRWRRSDNPKSKIKIGVGLSPSFSHSRYVGLGSRRSRPGKSPASVSWMEALLPVARSS